MNVSQGSSDIIDKHLDSLTHTLIDEVHKSL